MAKYNAQLQRCFRQSYSPVYLKTLHNQLSAILNHAVRYYGLHSNPAAKVGNMGKSKNKEMQVWTQEEYMKFADEMMDKPLSYYAFEMLYWCGIREGATCSDTRKTLTSKDPRSASQNHSRGYGEGYHYRTKDP